jgi:hypothetical protein
VKEHSGDAARTRRALAIWAVLQRARALPESAEVSNYLDAIEQHIAHGHPPPEAATLRLWRAENWFRRLHRLLLWWKQGSEPQEASGARDEVQGLLKTIERPPRVEEGAADPALVLAARELAADDGADAQDALTKFALARLNDDVIPAAEQCARFHAHIRSVEQRTALFAWLAGMYPIDGERSMAERFRNANARLAAIAGAEKEGVHLVALRTALQDEPLLEVLTTPAHPAVERVVALERDRWNEVRDLLTVADTDFPWPAASATDLQHWWAALNQLESALRTAGAQMQRLEIIGRSIWTSLKPHLEQAKSLGFSSPEIEALAIQWACGDLHAPRRLCERLAAMRGWSKILEQELVPATRRRKRGRR